MLNTEGWSVEAHVERPDTDEDSAVPRVETYHQLVNIIYSFVSKGVEQGAIHLYNYVGDVNDDLKLACNEVSQTDPFGSYAVEFMSYDFTRMVKYYQATVNISYLHTPEQIASISWVTGTSAIRDILATKFVQFAPEAVLRVGNFTEDKDYITALIQQAYYDTPVAALGMPKISVSLYPKQENEENHNERVVEIQLIYPEAPEVLVRKSERLQNQCNTLSYSLIGLTGQAAAESIQSLLREQVSFVDSSSENPVNTAYAALVDKRADSEGGALAFQLMAQKLGLESTVVKGKLEGADHFWNVVCLESGDYRHVDCSDGKSLLLNDAELTALGYVWSREDYPACAGPAPTGAPDVPTVPPANVNSKLNF